jgi:hypothetical protein
MPKVSFDRFGRFEALFGDGRNASSAPTFGGGVAAACCSQCASPLRLIRFAKAPNAQRLSLEYSLIHRRAASCGAIPCWIK